MTMSERLQQLRRSRTPFVHATVVRAQHPTSAHTGDQAILLSDGTIEGFVGGQCAQNSVRKAALGALQAGESVLLRVLPDGEVHFPEAAGACVVVNPCLSGGALEIFLDPQVPAPLVRICGATPIAKALAAMTATLGYEVHRDGDADLAQAAAVVVASEVRGGAILGGLALTDAERRRVHTPVGLPIGAKTPAEIAVSILAEVVRAIRVDGLIAPGRDAATPHVSREEACHGHG